MSKERWSNVSGNADTYGQFYWCILLKDGTEVYMFADEIKLQYGNLVMIGMGDKPYAIFRAGFWLEVYAASLLDGHYVAVEHYNTGAQTE